MTRVLLILGLAGSLLLGACQCDPGTTVAHGSPSLSRSNGGAVGLEIQIEFGPVFFGQSTRVDAVLRNTGRATLTIEEVLPSGPIEVVQEGISTSDSPFRLEIERPRLDPGEQALLKITFAPPSKDQAPDKKSLDYEASVGLRFGGTAESEQFGTIAVSGRGVAESCGTSVSLDFGMVAVGDKRRLQTVVRNPTLLPARAWLGPTVSSTGDHAAFAFAAGTPAGDFSIAPESELQIELDFRPTDSRPYLASFRARAAEECPEFVVTVHGIGVDEVVVWDPMVDCQYVPVGLEARRDFTFTNLGHREVGVFDLSADSPHFSIGAEAGGASAFTLGPFGGSVSRTAVCHPRAPGPQEAQVRFSTSLDRQPQGAVGLRAFGAGPDIDVQPSLLNFGKAAFVPGAPTQLFQTRKIYIQNLGSGAPDGDFKANLHLGTSDAKGGFSPPFFEVVPKPGTLSGEFVAELSDNYSAELGIRPVAGENVLPVTVRLTPASTGTKAATIRFYSNDLDEPVVAVEVTAQVMAMPPCNYAVTPSALHFGLVQPSESMELSFTIRNLGTLPGEVCLVSSLDLDQSSAASFELPTPLESLELPAGAVEVVRVLLHGENPGPTAQEASGAVAFEISSPDRPVESVTLAGWLGSTCLIISPSSLSFGSVRLGCNSASRTVHVYNACTYPVTIIDLEIPGPAGVPAGKLPECPGAVSCPEFDLVNPPVLPAAGVSLAPGAAPFTFELAYGPLDESVDVGSALISTVESGRALSHAIRLEGRGDAIGVHTDVFVQATVPKVDILLVVETVSTCGTGEDPLPALETTISDFHSSLVAKGIDFHMGIVRSIRSPGSSTGLDCDGPLGKLISGNSHSLKYIDSSTPNGPSMVLDSLYRALLPPGGCTATAVVFEAATRAVGPVLKGGLNSGFLRPDATLSIVSLSNSGDLSEPPALWWGQAGVPHGTPWPVTYYRDLLVDAKGGKKHMVKMSGITNFGACGPSTADLYGRMALMASLTGGFTDDICVCPPAWPSQFESLALEVAAGHSRFDLTSTPDATQPILVTVNGAVVPADDGQGVVNWSHETADNQIVFTTPSIPPPGSQIEIAYQPECH